jgi:hypothetical protein
MQFKSLAILFLGGQLAAAQTLTTSTTSSAPSTSGTSLPDMVDQIDECVLACIRETAPKIGCSATDFDCLCATDVSNFRSQITGCVIGRNGCDLGAATRSGRLIGPICDAVKDGASPSDVAEASKIVDGNDAKQTGDSDNDDDSAANGLVPNSLLALAVALFFL